MAFVLALVNPKGGVGKSTIATNLAVHFHDWGLKTALLDCDEQETSGRDVARVEPAISIHTPTQLEAIASTVFELSPDYDVLVIDSPGKSGEAVSTLCLLADFILIPLQPSKRDLAALGRGLTLIKAAQRARAGKPEAAFVLNFTRKRDVAARLVTQELAKLGIPVAKRQIRRLDALRDSSVVMRKKTPEEEEASSDLLELIGEFFSDRINPANNREMAAHE